MSVISEKVMERLISKSLTISTAESCTGGLLAGALIDYAGASESFKNGFVTYSNESKEKFVSVNKETLDTFGAVSEETARQMAENTAKISDTDIALSTTGIAGPSGGTKEKPVGLVYCGIYFKGKTEVIRFNFDGSRQEIRQKTVDELLKILYKKIEEDL